MITAELMDGVLLAAISTMVALSAGGVLRVMLHKEIADQTDPALRTPPKVTPTYYRSTKSDLKAPGSSEPSAAEQSLQSWLKTKQTKASDLYRKNSDSGNTKGLLGEMIAAQYYAGQGWYEHDTSYGHRNGIDLLLVRERRERVEIKAVEVKTTHSKGPIACGIQLSTPELKKRVERANELKSDDAEQFPVELLDEPGRLTKACFVIDLNTRQVVDAVQQKVLIEDVTPFVIGLQYILRRSNPEMLKKMDGFGPVEELSKGLS